ncbi:MAG TPA: alpha-L-rhamnosidase C-terminal domain-containing protein, partial [Chitinophaga sp.]
NGDYANSERERMMYEADCYIQQMSHYAIDRDFATARYSTENLIYHASWPTEWINHSVFMAWSDYLYTGNTDLIDTYYTDLKAKTLMALETPEGLISTRTGLQTKTFLKSIHYNGDFISDIVDWPDALQGIYPNGETDNYERKDYNTVVNAFYYRSLVLMAKMARATNHTADATFFETKADSVKVKFNDAFFDKTSKIYFDGIGSRHSAIQANMFPLAFGLVPDEYKESVVNYVKSKWMACGVYAANYLMEGLFNAEQSNYALELMTNDSDRGWLNMIRIGATMTIEAWDLKYDPNDLSWSHAWSASPAHLIPRRIMGIQPAEPGFGKIIIKPQPGHLQWAKMKLPSIHGDILADLTQVEGASFNVNTTIPANTTARVYLPKLPGSYVVTMDGKTVAHAETEGNWVVMDSPSGSHSFKIKKL